MQHRSDIRFILNDRDIVIPDVGADQTVLDFIRLDQRLTGTKEGCAEGDCGACTVLVGRLRDGVLHYSSVNACIRFLASLDGCHLVTVEHLSGPNGKLHPVQQAMVDHHASQCGFCTPGFVMSLYALWMQVPNPTADQVQIGLQGNLCRCTGYAPIIKAAVAVSEYGSPTADYLTTERDALTQRLTALADGARVETGPDSNRAILPANVDDLAHLLADHPDATVVAGATDVGLWVTKYLRPISPAIFIGHLNGLQTITVNDDLISIGAGVTYTDCHAVLAENFTHLDAYWNRIAGQQVRNMGTLGGNVANGSPIGDTPPVLIALGATVTLRHGSTRRSLPLQDFFIDYGKQDRKAGEFVERIDVPRARAGQIDAAYKISKRKDEDISAVAAGISVTVLDGTITDCRIAFGGMAATPKRATQAEAALRGKPWGKPAFDAAAQAMSDDFTPLTDWRASADYRSLSARNLLIRFFLEHDASTDQPVRLGVSA